MVICKVVVKVKLNVKWGLYLKKWAKVRIETFFQKRTVLNYDVSIISQLKSVNCIFSHCICQEQTMKVQTLENKVL